jgi:hypothetical protein
MKPVLMRKAMIPNIVKRRRQPNKNIKNKNTDAPLSTVVVKDIIRAIMTIEM